MENELRGLVMTKFRSLTSFANTMQWDRKKVSRIVNHIQKPTADDMVRMAKCLEIKDADTFVHIFLPSASTMWEQQQTEGVG